MSIIASLDIGSNTILLLVAKISANGRITPLLEVSRTPRLAHNLKKTGRISRDSLRHAIRDILHLKNMALGLGASRIYAAATQAIRAAGNRETVMREIHNQTGIKVEVISGRREAELTYRGAITGFRNLKPRRIMFDIGGASSEFVLAENDRIIKAVSLKIGAVEITEKYRTDRTQSSCMLNDISANLKTFFARKLKDFEVEDFDLIGSGGTISTYKLLESKPDNFDPRKIHSRSLSLDALEKLVESLGDMKLSERKRVIMFEPQRAEVIVAGGLILRSLLKHFGKNAVKVSTRSLRWGFLLSKL